MPKNESGFSQAGELYQKKRGLERHKQAIKKGERGLESIVYTDDGGDHKLLEEIDALLADADTLAGVKPAEEAARESGSQEAREIDAQLAAISEQLPQEAADVQSKKAFRHLRDFMSRRRKLLAVKSRLEENTKKLIQAVHADASLRENPAVWQRVSGVEQAAQEIDGNIEALALEHPVAFQAHWLLKMREWKRSYDAHGIIETAAIREQTRELMDDARRKLEGTNGVVTLLGPTGSGKTVLGKKIAAQFSPDGKYEFVSAHPKMTAFDLIARMGIVVEQLDPKEIPQMIKQAQEQYRLEHPDQEPETLAAELKTIQDVITGRAKEKTFETKKMLEAIGRAQKEGRMVVIDEFNYLPPDTLAALNDILSNKDNPPGFGVVLTGNIGEEYLKRQGLDPAFINRVLSGTVQYEFPPQEIDQAFDASIVDNEQRALGAHAPDRDLYQIAALQLADEKGNVLAPPEALKQVWDFTRIVSLAQQLASGKDFRALGLDAPVGTSAFRFKSVFLSFRNMNQVVREWKLEGYKRPLESYVFEDIIRPSAVFAPKEAAQLMYLFRDWGGMFSQENWGAIRVDTTSWRIDGMERVKDAPRKKIALKAFQPAEVVEAVSGYRLPEVAPEDEQAATEQVEAKEHERYLAEVEKLLREWEDAFGRPKFAVVEHVCAVRVEEGYEK